jgi:hypothetical protein
VGDIPITSVSQWGYDESRTVTKVLIRIVDGRGNHSDTQFVFIAVQIISQVRGPVEIVKTGYIVAKKLVDDVAFLSYK